MCKYFFRYPTKRYLSLLTAVFLFFSFSSSGICLAAAIGMEGDYIKTAVGDDGTLGTGGNTNPGIQYAMTTAGSFDDSDDYLTPGNPFECFVLKSTEGGSLVNNNNNVAGAVFVKDSLVSGSTYDNHVIWTGTSAGNAVIRNEYWFDNDEKKINIKTTVTALRNLTNVEFLRAIDPDPETTVTNNGRGYDANSDGDFTDAGDILQSDFVHSTGTISGYPLALKSTSAVTHNTGISSVWSTNPDVYLVATDDGNGDYVLGLAFNIGSLANGAYIDLLYAYVFGDTLEEVSDEDEPAPFSFTEKAITDEQNSVGSTLDAIDGVRADTDLQNVIDEMKTLPDDDAVRSSMDQLSGTEQPSLLLVSNGAMTSFMGSVGGRVSTLENNDIATGSPNFVENFSPVYQKYHATPSLMTKNNFVLGYGNGAGIGEYLPFGIWVRGYNGWGDRETSENIDGYTHETLGISAGSDLKITPCITMGISTGYSHSDIDYVNDNSGDIYAHYIGLYGIYNIGKYSSNLQLNYGKNGYKTYRNVKFGSIDRVAEGDYDGDVYSAYAETNRTFVVSDKAKLKMLVGFQATNNIQDSHTETGAGSLNLQINEDRNESYKISAGSEYYATIMESSIMSFVGKISGRILHELGETRTAGIVALTGAPDDIFIVEGSKVNRNTGIFGTSLSVKFKDRINVEIGYDYALNEDYSNHVISLGCRLNF